MYLARFKILLLTMTPQNKRKSRSSSTTQPAKKFSFRPPAAELLSDLFYSPTLY